MSTITDFIIGDVYAPKKGVADGVLIQVGKGGDMGVFRVKSPEEVEANFPKFRILMNQPDVKKRWTSLGNYPLSKSLSELAWYGDDDIGVDQKYKVQIINIDERVPIQREEFSNLERLAVWETEHVLRRLGLSS